MNLREQAYLLATKCNASGVTCDEWAYLPTIINCLRLINQCIHRYVLTSDISADMDHLILDQSVEMAITPGVHSYSFDNIKSCAHVIGLQPADDLLL